ncbi:MAG: tetrahydromethanopterin S-methyltransferase subunit A [Nitrososphaeraceae archaeon]
MLESVKLFASLNCPSIKDYTISMLVNNDNWLMKKTLNSLQTAAGKICEIVLPIRLSYALGNGETIAICTLSDMSLLKEIVSRNDIMRKLSLVGRLLSENRGIDNILETVHNHPHLRYLILCGRDGKGHLPGQALISLYNYGTREDGYIVGARGSNPKLKSTKEVISSFRSNIEIVDLIGSRDILQLELLIDKLGGQ